MTDNDILMLKLKRHKIAHKVKGRTIILKGSLIDYWTLLFLIILPLILLGFIFLSKKLFGLSFFDALNLKAIIFTLLLVSSVIVNSVRLIRRRESNKEEKILTNESLIFRSKNFNKTLYKSDIYDFIFTTEELGDNLYVGSLFVIDKDENSYPILGIEDESLQFIESDIKWFFKYFMNHFNLKIEDLEE